VTLIFQVWYLLRTNRAPLLSNISILLTSCAMWRAHTVEAYSIIGSTDVLKQCSWIRHLRFQCKNARAVLAIDNFCLTCSFQVSLKSITIPKYLTFFQWNIINVVRELERGHFVYDYKKFTFWLIKFHLMYFGPFF